MDKRCAPLPGSGEVFGNAYGRKPRPRLATGIVDAGARTNRQNEAAGKAKPGGLLFAITLINLPGANRETPHKRLRRVLLACLVARR
jgi:hypothetical protein